MHRVLRIAHGSLIERFDELLLRFVVQPFEIDQLDRLALILRFPLFVQIDFQELRKEQSTEYTQFLSSTCS